MEKTILFKSQKDCCGCGACLNICSKNAINMQEDKYGFLYPCVDENLCIHCGLCKKACGFQNVEESAIPLSLYAAANRNHDVLLNSSSGGIFPALASKVLEENGIVFGATLEEHDGKLFAKHISIKNNSELKSLQGSKYIQSAIEKTYLEAQLHLNNGKKVLFSGTPCQIAGLKAFLKRDYMNLITVDIICHGVPSNKLFQDYICELGKKVNGMIYNFKFRDKSNGWSLNGKAFYITDNGKYKEKFILSRLSSYYTWFLQSETYRESCYSCKYASMHRPGDISIGDYWDIDKQHPELMIENGGILSTKNGVSCIIINSLKGKMFIENLNNCINIFDTALDKISFSNAQLKYPSRKGVNREKILKIYTEEGFSKADKSFMEKLGLTRRMVYMLYALIPLPLKKMLRKIIAY